MKDDFYNRYIVKGNLFAPVVETFIRNNGRYNLLESAILELFEFIKLEDIKILCTYVVENFGKIFDEIQYVQTFKNLRNKYDQHQDRLKEKEKGYDTMPSILRNSSRFRRDARQPAEEEEMWFNEDDEFKDVPTDTKITPDLDSSISKMMFEKKAESVNSPKSALPQTNQVQTQLQQQFTSHLSTASVETIVNSPTNKSPSETMTSSESKFDQDDQTPKIEGNVESTPAKEDCAPLDGEAENSLDSSSSSSGSDTDNVGKSTFKSGDLWSSGSSDDEAPKKSLVDYESRDSDDENADEDLKDDDAPVTKKARLDLE